MDLREETQNTYNFEDPFFHLINAAVLLRRDDRLDLWAVNNRNRKKVIYDLRERDRKKVYGFKHMI